MQRYLSAVAPRRVAGDPLVALSMAATCAAAFLLPYVYLAHDGRVVLLVGAAVVLTAIALDRAALAVLAVPAVLLQQRVGGAISVSDVALTAAAMTAVAGQVPRTLTPQARLLLRCLAVYLVLLTISLVANPDVRGVLEWFHRISLVGGGVVVGAWLVDRDRHVLALRLLLAPILLIAVIAVAESAASGFAPAYPAHFHKNFAGSVFASTLVVVALAPSAVRLPAPARLATLLLLVAGLLATQSRGAMLAVVVAVAVSVLRSDSEQRRRQRPLLVLLAVAFAVVLQQSVSDQLAQANNHDSIDHRIKVETATRELWLDEPFTGVGLRYYKTDEFFGYQPPNNVLNETLAESGVPGLLGILLLIGGAAVALWRSTGELATAGLCLLLGRFVHGLLDIYWVAGTTTLPWLVVGMGLADQARRRSASAS